MAPKKEEAFLICMPWAAPSVFTDDVRATCCSCGQAVRRRPHAPKHARPLCIGCYADRASPDDEPVVTRQTLQEVTKNLLKQRH